MKTTVPGSAVKRGPCLGITIVSGVIWTVATVFAAQGREQPTEALSEDLRVERLTDGVWRHIWYRNIEGFGPSSGNGLVVISGEVAALIDTPWTEQQTRDLFRWVSKRLSAEITVVIATHSHPDCLGGLAAAHQLGARSYASKKTAKLARRGGKPIPKTTFKDTLEIEVGSRKLKLHAAGPGHTADNIVVWIPDQEILFGGCLVRSGSSKHLGYTKEADLERWPRTIETLIKEYGTARRIVPGHGAPGDAELLRHTLELLENR